MGVAVIGIIVICIDIAILIAIGSNPGYSSEARWACVALVAQLSLLPLRWLFGGHFIELEVKWQHHCRARRRAHSAAARVKNGR